MLNLKRDLLSAALAAAIVSLSQGAYAQTQQSTTDDDQASGQAATDLDTITVTSGIRRGIESAINLKQESTAIVDAVSAEDLGKLPDLSIAESISRLPGLASQRVAGRSSTISIRGFAGDFGTTLLNGREQVSVGDNRTVEFDQYPSELINSVVVYKTNQSDLVGQGLSGTVDLRTVRPLTYSERTISFNIRAEKNSFGEINDGSDDFGTRASAFYLDQFLDGRLGFAVGYARLDSPGQAEKFEASYKDDTINGVPGVRQIGGFKAIGSSSDNTRQGLMAVVQFDANENYKTTLDLYYSVFDKAETARFLESNLGWSGLIPSNATIENNVAVAGTYTGARPVLRNDLNEGDDKLFGIGWNNQIQITDDWSAEVDLSFSKADRQESLLETYSGYRAGITDTVDFRLIAEEDARFNFGLNYADPAAIVLTDPGGWGQDGYIKKPEIDDELRSFRVGLEKSFSDSMFSSLELGVNYADREKSRSVPEAFLELIGDPARGAGVDEVVVDPALLVRPTGLDFLGIPGTFAYEINGVFSRYYTPVSNINPDIANKQWTVNEKIITAFTQLNLDTEWGSIPVRGNIGVQMLTTDQSSSGLSVIQGDSANAVDFEGGANYVDWLPSLNLSFELPAENVLRFGLSKQLARPRIDQLRANNNTNLDFTQGRWTRSGGNPELDPTEANAFDVSWEKYFSTKGYVGLAYFYKDLRTYVIELGSTFDARGLPIPSGYNGPTPNPEGIYIRPGNGNGGRISGIEASVSIPFDIFTDALEGFGLVANHSDISSGVTPVEGGEEIPFPGLSDRVTNITVYYENYGFSTRLSMRKRSEFLGETQQFGADRGFTPIDGDEVLDFQAGYNFGEGALEGMSLLLQVNNLTDEPYREFTPETNLTRKFERYGRQYLLGVNYKF